MVNVRIRYEWEVYAAPLGQMPWTGSASGDQILASLVSWGLDLGPRLPDISGLDDIDRLSGRFVVADGEAYFEVVVHEGEASA